MPHASGEDEGVGYACGLFKLYSLLQGKEHGRGHLTFTWGTIYCMALHSMACYDEFCVSFPQLSTWFAQDEIGAKSHNIAVESDLFA